MCADRLLLTCLCGDRLVVTCLCADRLLMTCLCGDRLLLTCLCGDRLGMNCLCGDRLLMTCLCGDRLLMTCLCGGRRTGNKENEMPLHQKHKRDLVQKMKILRQEFQPLQPQTGHCRLEVSREEIFEVRASVSVIPTAPHCCLDHGSLGSGFRLPCPSVHVFHVNFLYTVCLLYTSPSPRDRHRSRMPSSA